MKTVVGPYKRMPLACRPYDPRALQVAKKVIQAIHANIDGVSAEHIGSTSVLNCPGKGVVDIGVFYDSGKLEEVKEVLAQLGFQKQNFGHMVPESRPMRIGSYEMDGQMFPVHAHVVAGDSEEAGEMRRFRNRLRKDPELLAQYVAEKERILAEGVVDSGEYADKKGPFVRNVVDL